MQKALKDIIVIDLSRVLAGPFSTQIMGDLGAQIIKVEKPRDGDDTRFWGPPFLKDANGHDTTESAYYLSTNRSKKSVAIDIKTEAGQALLHRLLDKADILIENFKVGGLEKYGLAYHQIKDQYPGLIYCSITGFGQNGPMAHDPGYDFLAQAMTGLMSCTGGPDQPPTKVGVALSDIMTGLNATIGILTALHHRHTTGKGQHIDVALTDCTLAALTNIAQYYLTSGRRAPRVGNAHATIVPYQSFEARDGHIIVAVGNDRQFQRLAACLGHPEWADDERFARNSRRVENREQLIPLIADIIKTDTIAAWTEKLYAHDIPCGPVNNMDQVFAMPQIQEREMEIKMDHPLAGAPVSLVGSPLKMSETPPAYDLPPPCLGQHTQDVLQSLLGMSAEEINTLEEQGIVQTAIKKDQNAV